MERVIGAVPVSLYMGSGQVRTRTRAPGHWGPLSEPDKFRTVQPDSALFTPAERERARRYHRPLYFAALTRLLLVLAVYGLLAGRSIGGLGWARDAASWAAIVITAATVVSLPFDLWRGSTRPASKHRAVGGPTRAVRRRRFLACRTTLKSFL